jgi:hypothetical protein
VRTAPPLVIPDPETDCVELNGPRTTRQGGYLHEHVLLRQDHLAAFARFLSAWTTPGPSDTVIRQAAIPELRLDQDADNVVGCRQIHGGLQCMHGFDKRQIHRSLDARERQTGEAKVEANEG